MNLIPMPENVREKEGFFAFEGESIIVNCADELKDIVPMIKSTFNLKIRRGKKGARLCVIYSETEKEESYSLDVSKEKAEIYAKTYNGAFYALQTLNQLFSLEDGKIPCLRITRDEPKYSWRGLHLDESRHFFGKETVKKLLDFMALYKMNRFHWHLTDDQGWRIEIEKYPLLTEIGSKRKGSQLGNWESKRMENISHEGYYTKDDIREIVLYAKKRCIEIVPEVDFPAHSAAAIASYNNLACRDIPCEVPDFFGGIIPVSRGVDNWNRTLCLGKDEVISFVFDVIDEVSELFPFEYFHVGGDEAPVTEWQKCPLCQERIKKEGLSNEVALQGWFTNKLNAYLKQKGKIMIGWNEVLAADITDRDIVAQYWTPKKDKNVFNHLKNDGQVILSWHKYFYFDMLHTYCTVKGTYNFTSKTAKIKPEWEKGILGLECENWTEWTDEEDELFFKLWHRSLAMSESAWSQEIVKNYKDFTRRLQCHKKLAEKSGIYYGSDEMTMKVNGLKKNILSKKNGFELKDFDSEYRLSKIYG